MRRFGLALAAGLLVVACGPPEVGGDAATAAARIKGGMESQAGAAQAFSTQAAAGAAKVATQVPGVIGTVAAVATQAPGAVATVQAAATQAPGAVATVQAAAGAAGTAVKGATGMTPDQIGQAARAEAARALNVPVDQITVERVEPVDWRDSSLGCGEPGKVYAQVITEGFRVVVNAGGQRREVHTDERGSRIVFCQNPTQ
jgi:hypothetical protein